jgi:hypothetical protein
MQPPPLSPNLPSASDQLQLLQLVQPPSQTHLQPVAVSSAHLLLLLPLEDSHLELPLLTTTPLRPRANPVDSLSEPLLDPEVRPQLRILLPLEVYSEKLELAPVDCLERAPLLLLLQEDYSGLPLRNLRTVQQARVVGSSGRKTRRLPDQARATSSEEELPRLVFLATHLLLPLLLHRLPPLRPRPTSLELRTGNEVLKMMATHNKRNRDHRYRIHLDQVSASRRRKLRPLRPLLQLLEASLLESLPSPLKGEFGPCM